MQWKGDHPGPLVPLRDSERCIDELPLDAKTQCTCPFLSTWGFTSMQEEGKPKTEGSILYLMRVYPKKTELKLKITIELEKHFCTSES